MDFSEVKLKATKTVDRSNPKIKGYDNTEIEKFQKDIRELYMEEW